VALQQALRLIEKTAKSPELTLDAGRGLAEIVSRYTRTFYGYNAMMKACCMIPLINDTGLATLILLVAEYDPKQKYTLIRLIHLVNL
jgi:hypothetical protein